MTAPAECKCDPDYPRALDYLYPDCPVHVDCDQRCRALHNPQTPDQWQAAAIHWRAHHLWGGCSHGS